MADGQAVAIYGIKACDTMRKARAWLDQHGVSYVFHDYKTQGIDRGVLAGWARAVGWQTLLNRSGTTFRKLPEVDRHELTEAKAIELMAAQPSMIKRPVLQVEDSLIVGFKPEIYATRFGQGSAQGFEPDPRPVCQSQMNTDKHR